MRRVDPVNQHELRLIGLSRSGNHAIINWLISQASGRTCFLNCAQPQQNPFVTAREAVSGEAVICNYAPFDRDRESWGDFSRKDWLLHSYEDCFLTMVCSKDFERQHDDFVGPSLYRTDVVILRDPYNLFASRLRSSYGGVTALTAVRIWKQHARQVLNQRKLLTLNPVAILYNRWVTDPAYRRDIATQLRLEFTDAGVERVPLTGGGSSFDGLRYDGQAQRMSVLSRWQSYVDAPSYRRMFDEDVHCLANAIFGALPAAEVLRREPSSSRAVIKQSA
jgi:hypothetical protein